jgi:uncharacterized membrane protein/3-hydroxymyristoyl/3-hydroxydecanoyl-(acyl carrier protein) dehydratase
VVPAIAYPLLAHGASLFRSPALTIASVIVLAAAILLPPLWEGRRWAKFALPAAAATIVGLWRIDAAALVLYLPPVLLNIFLAWLFGHTLARGRTPLIERLVRLLQPKGQPPGPEVVRYAGQLTRVWTGLFVGLGAMNLGLALCATPNGLLEAIGVDPPLTVSRETWSLFANVLNYLIVAAFFLLEFTYRMRRFPDRPYRNLAEFLRRAAALGPALAATLRAHAETAPPQGLEAPLNVPVDHPAFDGHFPGRPVLPAVALLGLVIDAAEREFGRPLAITGLPRAKFLAPLLPGDNAAVSLRLDRGQLHFEVRNGPVRVALGVFQIEAGEGLG